MRRFTNSSVAASLLVAALAFAGCGETKPSRDAVPSHPAGGGSTVESPQSASVGPVEIKTIDPADLQKVLDGFKSQNKAVFVDFWATWCSACRERFPLTVEHDRKYRKDGLVVVTVALEADDTTKDAALKFLTAQKADFTNLLCTTGEDAFNAFEIPGSAIPHYRIYDKTGALVRQFDFSDPNDEKRPTEADVEASIRTAVGLDPASK